jgi:hypothetical protein
LRQLERRERLQRVIAGVGSRRRIGPAASGSPYQ